MSLHDDEAGLTAAYMAGVERGKDLGRAAAAAELALKADAELERLRAALTRIAALDPHTDSPEGYNEWGEADCFNQAKDIARAALAPQEQR